MSRKQTTWAITLTAIALFAGAIWQTVRHWAWLEARHLGGIVSLDLIGLGVVTFAIPLHLNSLPDGMTPGEMARDVLLRGVLALLAAKFGEKLLDKAADGYAAGLEWLEARITY